jgi:glycosyltransferase involved in cell wall biosynthesis
MVFFGHRVVGPMKVTVLCRRLDGKPSNGFERYSQNLYDALQDKGIDLHLPNQHVPFPVRPSGSLISPPYYDLLMPLRDLLLGHMDADVFHAVTDSQALVFPWLRGKKVITMHHVDKTAADSAPERVFRAFYGLGTKIALRYADKVICISSQTKSEVMEAYDIPEEKIALISQAIPASFRPLPQVTKEAVIGYVGALKKRKNIEFLIRAYAIYSQRLGKVPLRLVICGEGTDQAALERLAMELGVANGVEFRGPIPEEKLVETYNSFSLFSLPSHQEGFGFPIIEAQACGVPVLTMKGAMIPEEVSRYAVKCENEEDMARWMDLLINDRQKREHIITEGLLYASKFSVEEMGQRTLAIYRELMGPH